MPIIASPRTWVSGEVVTAAYMNSEIRDQFQAVRNAVNSSATATVANSTTETVIASYSIPASQAAVGSVYKVSAFGNISFLASAQLTWRLRIGGLSGTVLATMGPTTASGTGQTNKEFHVRGHAVCLTTGASGTWFGEFHEIRNWTQAGSVGETQLFFSDGGITRDTTAANDLVITAQWAAASASNTLTARSLVERFV
jgi:hypothetical protein